MSPSDFDEEQKPRRTAQFSSSSASPGGLPPELNPRRGAPAKPPATPAAAGSKRKKRRPARVLSWIAVSLSIIVLLGSGGAYLYVEHFNGQITRLAGITKGNTDNSPSVNYLLVGVDSREGANGELGAGTTVDVQGLRTDTMMIIHISKKSSRATIISLPRDSYVAIPGHGSTKLNAAVPLGGPALLVQTLEQLTGMQIDHYIQVDFVGFEAMTNAVGGVNVCLSSASYDKESGANFKAGINHLEGARALAFVRQRYGLPGGDLDRIKHQQVFIGALVRKITSAGTLLNPFKLTHLLDVATKAVKVDDHLTTGDMKQLATRLRKLDPAHVVFETIPVTGTGNAGAAGSVVFLDQDKLATFFSDIDNDVVQEEPSPTPTTTSTQPLTVAPGNIRVDVFNGTSINGKGHQAADSLTSAGFGISTIQTATGGPYPQSVVKYGPSRADSARTLAAAVPGSILQADSSLGSTVTLIVGTNFTGAKKVTVGTTPAKPTTATTTSASPKPQANTAATDNCAPGNNG